MRAGGVLPGRVAGLDRGALGRVVRTMRDKAGELVAPDVWLTEDMLAPGGESESGDEGACGADASGEDGRAPFELPAPAYSSMERYREFVDGCFGRRGGFNPQDPVHRQVRIMLMCGAVIYTLADGREVVVPAPEVLKAVFPGRDFSPRS